MISDLLVRAKSPSEARQVLNSMVEVVGEYVAMAKGLANEEICCQILTGLPPSLNFVREGFALMNWREPSSRRRSSRGNRTAPMTMPWPLVSSL